MAKGSCTSAHPGHMCILNILFQIQSPCCCIITSILLGSLLLSYYWSMTVGIYLFNHKGIGEARLWSWARRPGERLAFQFIPIYSKCVKLLFSALATWALPHHLFIKLALCTKTWWNRFEPFSFSWNFTCNARTYKDLQFGQDPHMDVMVRCPQTLGYIV